MFKKIANKVTSNVKSQVTHKAHTAASQAKNKMVKQFKGFVTNQKKCNKKISGKIITDFDEFKASWEKNAKDPGQTILHFLYAAYVYAQGEKEKGNWMCTVVMPKTFLLSDAKSPTKFKVNMGGDGYFLEHMAEQPRIVNSYLGGSPTNNYEINPDKVEMHVVSEGTSATDATLFIQSAGKDFASPVNLRKNNEGQWKIFAIGSIATGVQKTEFEKGDF